MPHFGLKRAQSGDKTASEPPPVQEIQCKQGVLRFSASQRSASVKQQLNFSGLERSKRLYGDNAKKARAVAAQPSRALAQAAPQAMSLPAAQATAHSAQLAMALVPQPSHALPGGMFTRAIEPRTHLDQTTSSSSLLAACIRVVDSTRSPASIKRAIDAAFAAAEAPQRHHSHAKNTDSFQTFSAITDEAKGDCSRRLAAAVPGQLLGQALVTASQPLSSRTSAFVALHAPLSSTLSCTVTQRLGLASVTNLLHQAPQGKMSIACVGCHVCAKTSWP